MIRVWHAPLLKQSTRRWLVIGCYGGYAALVLAWVFVGAALFKTALLLLFGLTCVICMGMLMMPNILGISDGMEQLLDERQRTFRNAMYVWAYRILSVLLVVISVYVYIASDFNKTWWLPHSSLELQAAF